MKDFKFSIIIPHKNIPDLLQRCLDSIPQRDDIQIIVVDDNSDPNIVNFSNFLGEERNNVEIYFDKSGKGAGRARNIGLKHAKGEWILFADCDDYYITSNLNALLNQDIPDECELVVWGIRHQNFNGSIWDDFVDNESGLIKLSDSKEFIRRFSPWRSMVRSEIIYNYNIRFEEIPASNDVMFHTILMTHINFDNAMWFPSVVYIWECRKGSITHSLSLPKAISRFRASLRANRIGLKQKWGIIDNTKYYLIQLKELSRWQFYIGFYWEWVYLGWNQAIEDYRFVCAEVHDRKMLYLNPFIFLQSIYKKHFRYSKIDF